MIDGVMDIQVLPRKLEHLQNVFVFVHIDFVKSQIQKLLISKVPTRKFLSSVDLRAMAQSRLLVLSFILN